AGGFCGLPPFGDPNDGGVPASAPPARERLAHRGSWPRDGVLPARGRVPVRLTRVPAVRDCPRGTVLLQDGGAFRSVAAWLAGPAYHVRARRHDRERSQYADGLARGPDRRGLHPGALPDRRQGLAPERAEAARDHERSLRLPARRLS